MPKRIGSKQNSIYQLKIALKGVAPPIWRRLQVPGDTTLYKLSNILLGIMSWSGGHLHSFIIDGKYYGTPDPEFETFHDTIEEKKVKLKDIIKYEKKKFVFDYDFGDGWSREVVVERILPREKGRHYPVCLKGKRACPPEDCGGPYGYRGFLDAISDPDHPEHKSMDEWIGVSFDPEEFDLEAINESLKGINKRKPWLEDFV